MPELTSMKNGAFLLVLNLLVKHITTSRNNYPDDKTNLVSKYVVIKIKDIVVKEF